MIERNLRFYMANLGSEISRYFSYVEKGQSELADKCLERAEDILEKAMVLPEARSRLYELEVISSVLKDMKNNFGKSGIKSTNLKNYFLPFAQKVLAN